MQVQDIAFILCITQIVSLALIYSLACKLIKALGHRADAPMTLYSPQSEVTNSDGERWIQRS